MSCFIVPQGFDHRYPWCLVQRSRKVGDESHYVWWMETARKHSCGLLQMGASRIWWVLFITFTTILEWESGRRRELFTVRTHPLCVTCFETLLWTTASYLLKQKLPVYLVYANGMCCFYHLMPFSANLWGRNSFSWYVLGYFFFVFFHSHQHTWIVIPNCEFLSCHA